MNERLDVAFIDCHIVGMGGSMASEVKVLDAMEAAAENVLLATAVARTCNLKDTQTFEVMLEFSRRKKRCLPTSSKVWCGREGRCRYRVNG